jgi:ubiquitin-activating enzyme E1 C
LSQLELAVLLYRVQDVGKSKAEVAAKRVMERVNGVNIVPHFCRIEDKEIEFYSQFHIIVLGLDSIEARSYINSVACGFLGMFFLYHFFVDIFSCSE